MSQQRNKYIFVSESTQQTLDTLCPRRTARVKILIKLNTNENPYSPAPGVEASCELMIE